VAKRLNVNLHYRFVSETPLTDENDVFANPYHLLNANIDYRLPLDQKITFFGGIENIFNTTYSLGNDLNAFGGRFYQPAPKRNFYLGAKWSF
jgi:iron complex outermembrane receptor protein